METPKSEKETDFMSQTVNTATQFDKISQVYDETREPLKEVALNTIKNILLRDGCSSLIEVGVGTGRVAKPLQDRGFEIVGLDVSKDMLLKAKEKGVMELILADANYLPIKEKSFDTAFLAHVLQIFENPAEVFGKIVGVVKKEVVALVSKRDDALANDSSGNSVMRQIFEHVSAEMGYALPRRAGEWRRKESEFLAAVPPTELITIQDELIETTIDERLSFFEKRAFRYSLDIPDEVL
ncbi:MAG: class I SAM-dependent methyltransferase [Nitrososphaeria archaeon]|jgi:ubiquinone/menaquinone biosynthesis C-methylase UbiE